MDFESKLQRIKEARDDIANSAEILSRRDWKTYLMTLTVGLMLGFVAGASWHYLQTESTVVVACGGIEV
ncbi:hypothetical protein Q6D67_05130 [Haliea sp. E1-2-M8]|uniref:hypothetical protein n=1 Tax=Haliea sp. E1-2-M8 TaxID=3064706 RepID=UPI00271F4EFE|nr:hypothetical protein [Haliea sp. E1-2-M8]MDO8861080.1 hypothetical protein [Haliea sp. E1-2-M8]